MVRHLDDSVKPTMSSGEHTLTNGKSDIFASCAARAVFPEFGGPSNNKTHYRFIIPTLAK